MSEPMVIEIAGSPLRPTEGQRHEPIRHDVPCTYAGLTMTALASVPFVLLVAVLGLMIDDGLRPAAVSVVARRHGVRPWVRGPPPRL